MANTRFDPHTSSASATLFNMFAITLDDMKAQVEQLGDYLSINYAKPEYLSLISTLLGFPVDTESDPEFIRRQLRTAIDWYKSKGTAESFRILFYNLGYEVEIRPLWTPDYCGDFVTNIPHLQYLMVLADYVTHATVTVTNPDNQSDSVTDHLGLCI